MSYRVIQITKPDGFANATTPCFIVMEPRFNSKSEARVYIYGLDPPIDLEFLIVKSHTSMRKLPKHE